MAVVGGGICSVMAVLLALSIGPVAVDWSVALTQRDSLDAVVLYQVRLPRVLLALLVGAGLGISGAAMQGLLRNPLADPGVLGVSTGASLGAVLTLYFGSSALLVPAAVSGAFTTLLLMFLLAGKNASVLGFILAGVAVNAVAGSLIAVALNFAPNLYAIQEIVFWLMGSFANRHMGHVGIAAPLILVGSALIIYQGRLLAALSLGEESAASMGFNVRRGRFFLLLGVAACVAGAVAVSGSIAFVGLVVPHLLRPLVGHHPQKLLWVSALAGAWLLLLADMLVRLLPDLLGGQELKIGVVTSLLGGPFFLYLLVKRRAQWG